MRPWPLILAERNDVPYYLLEYHKQTPERGLNTLLEVRSSCFVRCPKIWAETDVWCIRSRAYECMKVPKNTIGPSVMEMPIGAVTTKGWKWQNDKGVRAFSGMQRWLAYLYYI
jgi:hypothetical protein